MKSLKVAVYMKEPGCARDLARGLAEQGNQWAVVVCDGEIASQDEWEILVTDFDVKEVLGAEIWASRVIWAGEPWPVSVLAGQVSSLASELGWERCPSKPDRKCRLAAFFSSQGGSGVTSAALTAGRILAGGYGERVLYLPLTYRDGSLRYRSRPSVSGCSPVKELLYRFRNCRPVSFERFIEADDYGLEYLSSEEGENCLQQLEPEELDFFLQKIKETGTYDWIFADCGTGKVPLNCFVRVAVDNLQDSRVDMRAADGEAGFLLKNHGTGNRTEVQGGQVWCEILHDEDSFFCGSNGITEISMSKSFSSGIKKFSERLLDTMPNSVDTW